jgi:REP element-mobilizing transposase RayT
MPHRFKVYDPAYPHFVTSTVLHWIPVFCRDDYFRVLVDSFHYCISNRGLRVHAFVLMPNHFHAVCSQQTGDLVGVMRDLKRYCSRQ